MLIECLITFSIFKNCRVFGGFVNTRALIINL